MFSHPHMNIIVIGHVDHGKSTLIGRLLLDTNSLPEGKLREIKMISQALGKDAELAFLTDQLKEEREQEKTIDTTQVFFKSRKRHYVIIDAPGHVEFIKNMLTGASQAESAVLLIDVNAGVKEQTRRHAYIIGMLGIDKVIIVFNKMDLVNYKQERFEEAKIELSKFMAGLGIKPYFIIPASAKDGANISRRTPRMDWYKGPCLLEAFDSLRLNVKPMKKPLRFPVKDIYEIGGERIIVGKVLSGIIKQGQTVMLFPSFKSARITSIKVFGEIVKKACIGENIGLLLDEAPSVKRSEVIAQKDNPPKPTDHFKGNIFWMSHQPLRINETITLRCSTQEVQGSAEKIEKRINASTLETLEENASELKMNEAGVVVFRTERPIIVEKFVFIEELGRFVIEREGDLKGAGVITEN
jgi:sulfate adenylyltransferase large subunit